MQDVEPWTDANGYTHRNPVNLKAAKVEFETKAMLTNKQFVEIMNNIRDNYYNATGRIMLRKNRTYLIFNHKFMDYLTE